MAPTRQQRVLGALLGVHAGDSLGATVEFSSWEAVRRVYPDGVRDIEGGGPFCWPAGHATDDTDLTRAVLLAYAHQAETGTKAEIEDSLALARAAGDHMLDWYDGRWPGRKPGSRPVDVGGATCTGLVKFRETGDARQAGAGSGQAGNGSLMRCIATGLFAGGQSPGPDQYDRLLRESALISAITHDDGRCMLACAAYNAMVAALVAASGAATPEAAVDAGVEVIGDDAAVATMVACLGWEDVTSSASLEEHRDSTLRAIEHGRRGLRLAELAALGPKGAPYGPEALPHEAGGYVLESLTLAVAALLDGRPLVEVLVDVVRVGRDTDTNGAIAGGLLGARDGVLAIPATWRHKLQFVDEFTSLVEQLVPE